ncbi:MAG: class I SAM-dependent methyltransferase [Legionella sp.]
MILSPAEETTIYYQLNDWFASPEANCLAWSFTQALKTLSPVLKGNVLIQLGGCGSNRWLSTLSYCYQWVIVPYFDNHFSVQTSICQLPFAADSVDCVLAPLTFDLFGPLTNLIDEIDRILKPMGHLIILGINPLSLWKLTLTREGRSVLNHIKSKICFSFMLRQALLKKNYQQILFTKFDHILPINSDSIMNGLKGLNTIVKLYGFLPSSLYCLIVQKLDIVQPDTRRSDRKLDLFVPSSLGVLPSSFHPEEVMKHIQSNPMSSTTGH